MDWLWISLWILVAVVGLLAVAWVAAFYSIKRRFFDKVLRIFQEKPLFIVPRGKAVDDAEQVTLTGPDGLKLAGCYLKTTQPARLGVILFGLEFGSNRWACVPYCTFLREAGFDVFTFEFRNQGDSDPIPGYEPLQWVTNHEVQDMRTALAYLQGRDDADPRGIGFFGISKGAGAGLLAAARNDYVRCFVTDGVFATHTTMVPYMRKWIGIYSRQKWIYDLVPTWYFAMFAHLGLRKIAAERRCRFPHLEHVLHRLAPRPLLMIHGQADTYIKPEMAQDLYERASQPKELWLVDRAKHNQAFQIATEEYQKRVLAFFQTHLADDPGTDDAPHDDEPRHRNQPAPVTASRS